MKKPKIEIDNKTYPCLGTSTTSSSRIDKETAMRRFEEMPRRVEG